ncbi:hypothetical protein PSI9734_02029 [Pseudidiomarina piscicola]|uniref:Uncharacterized protein n=1 Tax=Pseudidiomarina piscicola TaxID=2614830 RepID=A0A6S6WNX3_9GAMM|nr:DUF6776 family protein [Pseudidiomarina piscicola]CAB0151654.1 hypothetical protein PSI9734_02029 [Pseudidiomarina piscicola]VZT41119.1 hypothetical protein PSI9734_02029 [Pseudomonas aeruginosa]
MNEKQKFGLIAAVALSALLLGYFIGGGHHWYLSDRVDELEQRVELLYEQAETADYQKHIAEVELGIERAASEQLELDLAAGQDEILALRRELSFYQKIMAPELEAQGVVIDAFELYSLRQPGHFQFRLAVVQTDRQRGGVKGTLHLELHGRTATDKVALDLFDLAELPATERNFSMRYFKVQTGSFRLPSGVEPESIEVRVEVDGSGNTLLERTFLWSELSG